MTASSTTATPVAASSPDSARLVPRLETARLVLRAPAEDDAGAIVAGIGDFAVSRMLSRVPHPYAAEDARRWLALVAEDHATGRSIHLAITEGGKLIGVISLEDYRGNSHFGYWLARPYWGRGFATEAATALLRHVFEALPVERIGSCVFAENAASLRVQEKLGFRQIGAHRAMCLARNSEVDDIDTALEKKRFLELNR